jgi:NAD-dependent DNA ligase
MIQLKDIKRGLFINADKYFRENQKSFLRINGLELKIGCRLKAAVSNKGVSTTMYLTPISLDPGVIAYWIQGEYGIYVEPVDFTKLLKKREIEKRTSKDQSLHPQNFRVFSTKALNAGETREILRHIPRLEASQVKSMPNSLVLTAPTLIYDFAKYVTADKVDIDTWLFELCLNMKNNYHTGKTQSVLTDDQYDDLKDFLAILDPKRAKPLQAAGAPVAADVKKKVTLEYPMGSLTKIKPDGISTKKFLKESKDSQYVLTDKMDGLSFQLKYVDTKLVQATTRGDGAVGQDITKHVHLIPTVPKVLPAKFKGTWNIRAEGILTNADFELLKNSDPKREYANPRNLVAGAVNRNVPNTKVLQKLNVVCYAIMSHERTLDKIDQLKALKEMGFHVVNFQVLKTSDITESDLTNYINERKRKGGFDLDGAVLECNSAKIRQSLGNETNSIDPRYARAYKVGDTERIEASVLEVMWEASKHGKLKPRIRIKPTKLGGVTVTYATAFNAAFVRDNKLGPGAKVLLTRSGDVIPFIVSVITKAARASLPDVKVFGSYDWNETQVDLVLVDAGADNDTVKIKQITSFFTKIGVDYLGQGIIEKFYASGLDDIDKIINTSIPELMAVEGIQRKSAEKLYNNIVGALSKVELPTLAAATPFFGDGFGETRLTKIYEVYGNQMFDRWAKFTVGEVAVEISGISGFSESTAKQFAKGIKPFNSFLKRNAGRIHVQEKKKLVLTGNNLKGITVCWTGIRQSNLEDLLKKNGGEVYTSVKPGLTYLVAKDPNSASSKTQKAKALGVKIVGPVEIEKIFNSKI